MRHLLLIASLLCCISWFSSCSDDDSHAPNWELSFVDALTDHNGTVTHLRTDDGTVYAIDAPFAQLPWPSDTQAKEGNANRLTPDSIYRCISSYEKTGTASLRISNISSILTTRPAKKSNLGTDPINLQSVWRGSRYLNVYFTVMGIDGKHLFTFVEDSITRQPSGINILHLTLRHTSQEAIEGYPRKLYISCILEGYDTQLKTGRDSIYFSVPQSATQIHTVKLEY